VSEKAGLFLTLGAEPGRAARESRVMPHFEIVVYIYVRCSMLKYKTYLMATIIARGEFITIDARDFVVFDMHLIVDDAIDARYWAFFAQIEYLSPRFKYLIPTGFCHI
jgi:hypothetical protein